MATAQSEIMSDEVIQIKCSLCMTENRTREAVKYCVQCKEYFCSPCVDAHNRFTSMREHKLMDKTDLGFLGQDGSLPGIPTQRCTKHPLKIVDMFCKDHDEVACASCIALTHRTCTTIHSIPEEIDSLYNKTQLTTIKQKIHKTKTSMQEIKSAKEKQVKELKEAFEKEVESVKALRQELQELLVNMEKETIKELKQEFDRIEASLTREINEANDLMDSMEELSTQLKKSEGNKAQEFVSMKATENVTTMAEDVEKEIKRKSEETVSFIADQNITGFLKQIKALGKVSCNKQNINCQKDSLYKVKLQREIDVKLVNDRSTCSIFGSCITEDGFMLFTDYKNKKLKGLDMSTETVTDYIEFQASPHAVCLINKTEAAVTLNDKTVQFVSLGTKLTATHTLTLNHPCWGLAYKDGKLFISDSGNTVYIHDINGQELKKISTDASGKQIFQRSYHIQICAAGDRLFVADMNKGLVILDIQGNYLSTLTDPNVIHLIGVCTDDRNLFVCGYSSKNIVQIGQDYKMVGELVKVTSQPVSVCFDPHKTRLIVTYMSSNKIIVLELE